jgi:hypothetical protein
MQDPSAVWSQQADPNQWASSYYGYGYDAYGYAQDPAYAYSAYAGYGQYPQQVIVSIRFKFIVVLLYWVFFPIELCFIQCIPILNQLLNLFQKHR